MRRTCLRSNRTIMRFFGRYEWNRYLQNPDVQMPDQVKDIAEQKLSVIYAADGIAMCAVTGEFLDYSQFKLRGCYDPKFHLLKFRTIEANFWSDGKNQNVQV